MDAPPAEAAAVPPPAEAPGSPRPEAGAEEPAAPADGAEPAPPPFVPLSAEDQALLDAPPAGGDDAAPAAGGKRKAGGDGCAADKPPQKPLTLGPKTFPTSEACFRYFSSVLAAQTVHQDINEARARAHARQPASPAGGGSSRRLGARSLARR